MTAELRDLLVPTAGGGGVGGGKCRAGAAKGQVWTRHLAPAAPAFTRPSSPHRAGGGKEPPFPNPPCDSPSGCCSFTGPWTVTRSSLRMLRRVAAFCRPLRPVLLRVSFPRSRSPVVGVPGLCRMWRAPFVRSRCPVVGVPGVVAGWCGGRWTVFAAHAPPPSGRPPPVFWWGKGMTRRMLSYRTPKKRHKGRRRRRGNTFDAVVCGNV